MKTDEKKKNHARSTTYEVQYVRYFYGPLQEKHTKYSEYIQCTYVCTITYIPYIPFIILYTVRTVDRTGAIESNESSE